MSRDSLTRRYPTALRDPFWRNFERFFEDDVFRPFSLLRGENLAQGWVPPVDIRETDEGYEFTAELPGLTRDDIKLTVEDKVLTLTGERSFEETEDRNSYHRVERAYGSFSRSFTLPGAVNADQVKAHFDNGLLKVTVPKADEVKPRKIEIR